MNQQSLGKIIKRVNLFFDNEFKTKKSSYVLCADTKYIEEHKYCYSVGWCLKNEINIHPSKRTLFAGGGPVMVSKISDDIEMGGSSPTIDFVKEFELKIRGLEGYWNLEIKFDKLKLSSLKTLLNKSTPELLKLVDINSKINIEKEKYELDVLQNYLNLASIDCKIEFKERKKATNTVYN